jgi:hypothetical protein
VGAGLHKALWVFQSQRTYQEPSNPGPQTYFQLPICAKTRLMESTTVAGFLIFFHKRQVGYFLKKNLSWLGYQYCEGNADQFCIRVGYQIII